jgi:hypothetical protein
MKIQRIGRFAAVLAGLGAALLALAAAAPAAFASLPHYPPAAPVPATTTRVITVGGMAGWQIALIAAGAALLAATMAVLADRARAARRPAIRTAA